MMIPSSNYNAIQSYILLEYYISYNHGLGYFIALSIE